MDAEENLCRVCREGVSEGPLFHPCACTGSIRFVHERCLNSWVAVSRKDTCELCGAALRFVKVFSAMPDRLPSLMLIRRIIQSISDLILLVLRAVLVLVVWLAVIPYIALYISRSIFFTSHYFGQLLRPFNHAGSSFLTPPTASGLAQLHVLDRLALRGALPEEPGRIIQNAAAVALESAQKLCTSAAGSFLGDATCDMSTIVAAEPRWRTVFNLFVADVLSGQIITAAVVVVFVIGFLFREWLLQNGPLPAPLPVAPDPVAILLPGMGAPMVAPAAEEIRHILAEMLPMTADEQGDGLYVAPEDREEYDAWDGVNDPEAWGSPSERKRRSEEDWWEPDDQPFASTSHGIAPRERTPVASTSDFRFDFDENGIPANVPDITPALAAAARNPRDRPISRRMSGNRARRTGGPRTRSQGSPVASRSAPLPAVPLPVPPPPPPPLNATDAATHFLGVPPPAHVLVMPDHPPDVHDHDHDFGDDIFDDMGAIMEAIGMKGSLSILLQNSLVVLAILIITLGVLVWIPLMVGKVLAAINIFSKLLVPVKMVRIVSDPLLDAGLKVLGRLTSPLVDVAGKLLPTPPPVKVVAPVIVEVASVTSQIAKSYPSLLKSFFLPSAVVPVVLPAPIVAPAPLLSIARIVATIKDIPLVCSRLVEAIKSLPTLSAQLSNSFQLRITNLGASDTTEDRIECIIFGYASILSTVALYFLRTTEGSMLHQDLREMVKKQMLLVKVISFVLIEVVVFPSVCGLVLNLVSLPLFPETTITTRIAYYSRAPVSGCFLTWLAGTCFMFGFSIAVDTLRSIIRVGSLFFIRDPANNDHHPLREILSRGSLAQARKIAISGVLYASVIISCFGVSIAFLRYVCVGILPLRWSYHSLTAIPLDLVLYRFVLPFSLGQIDPRAKMRIIFVATFKNVAQQFRLSHFLFGVRRIEEEVGDAEGEEGSWVRVPASDNIKIRAGRKVFIPVTEAGQPVDQADWPVISEQVLEMMTTRRDDQYQVIYFPPRWKLRLAGFIGTMWLATIVTGMILFVVPLRAGRELLEMVFPGAPIHDLYAILVGFHFGVGGVFVMKQLLQQRRLPKLRHLHAAAHLVIGAAITGFALPITLAAFLQLSFVFPFSSDPIPTFDIPQLWCFGAIILNIILYAVMQEFYHYLPQHQALHRFLNYWDDDYRIKALVVVNGMTTFQVLGPLMTTLIISGLINSLFYEYQSSLSLDQEQLIRASKVIYFVVGFLMVTLFHWPKLQQWAKEWVKEVREEEFLVSRRLQNYVAPEEVVVLEPVGEW